MSSSSIDLKSLPPWDYEQWTTSEPKETNSLKEKLLLGSLELIRDEPDNEDACREIVEQSLESRLFEIAFEAIRTFSQSSAFDLCVSITAIFKEMRYWKHLSEEFIDYCEKRVLKVPECRSGMGFGGHFCDQRSRTLGYLGRYRFFTSNAEMAINLWDASDDRQDVDEVIAEMCEMIAKKSPQYLETSLNINQYDESQKYKSKNHGNFK
jgi:hypothetical protein